MGASNYITGFVNLCTMLLSLPIIGAGIWLAQKHSTECMKFLQWPVIAIGLFMLFISICGFVGGCCRVPWLLWLYALVMFLLILLLLCFTIFAFAVTNKGAGRTLSGVHWKEYRLGDYSNWLQKRVENTKNWNKIKSCLSDAKTCDNLDEKYTTETSFNNASLSSLQSGCCKPPSSCGFTYVNATNWQSPKNPSTDTDCNTWNNDGLYCYSCNSCKAGLLQLIKTSWHKVAVVNVVVLILLIVLYSIGCCAFRNARRIGRDPYYYYKRP